MRTFNITGTCFPDRHYMVDMGDRLAVIKNMIDQGDYFCINRGRQYGKTTMLESINRLYSKEYAIFQLSFEGLADSSFLSLETLMGAFLGKLWDAVDFEEVRVTEDVHKMLADAFERYRYSSIPGQEFERLISLICKKNDRSIVILIDEVDQAGNWESFVQFLGTLRNMYLNRNRRPTFHSVILAGVYDIKNLKLKIRTEGEHQYNSPWNIAAPFEVEMAFAPKDIATMLQSYEYDHHTGMDIEHVSKLLYEYTGGYPFLVSRMCQLIEQSNDGWNRNGVLDAERVILNEKNTLFDDMIKKLDEYPEMYATLYDIIIKGEEKNYNSDEKSMDLLRMFNFIINNNGKIGFANRLFETRICNLLIAQQKQTESMLSKGAIDKPLFIQGKELNMPGILERFSALYTDLYSNRDETFDEDEGRKKFLFYIKPIINGTGNYYMESQTRNRRRTDLIIDYLGHQYIIEMKIWNGQQYHTKGEKQLVDYLKCYNLSEGYMLTFNFNKKKQPGMTKTTIEGKTIYEMVV